MNDIEALPWGSFLKRCGYAGGFLSTFFKFQISYNPSKRRITGRSRKGREGAICMQMSICDMRYTWVGGGWAGGQAAVCLAG